MISEYNDGVKDRQIFIYLNDSDIDKNKVNCAVCIYHFTCDEDDKKGKLEAASPITYAVGNNLPYTILAYGSNLNTPPDNPTFTSGDTLIPYSQVDAITGVLDELGNSVDRYVLYTFDGVAHGDFGAGGIVCPNTNVQAEALKATINAYYAEIASKLQFNS